ncbi:hypothetical protein HDV00_005952 [Rhizophlyctis rosea]|nr:hypothetical protein HDV00_005952 [Rhizophlyctis rosea]
MPKLSSIEIYYLRHDVMGRLPAVDTLTQPSLTHLALRGPWPGILSKLPNITCRNLASITIELMDIYDDVQIEEAAGALSQLHNLTYFRLDEDTIYNGTTLRCQDIARILSRIPSTKLKTFRLTVCDLRREEIRRGLRLKPGLEEVVIYTCTRDFGDDVWRVCAEWGAELGAELGYLDLVWKWDVKSFISEGLKILMMMRLKIVTIIRMLVNLMSRPDWRGNRMRL